MKYPRIRVLNADGKLLGEITFVADLVIGQALKADFRPADYEPLFRAYIAVMRAEHMADADETKAPTMAKAKGILRRTRRCVGHQLQEAQPLLWGYNIVVNDTDIFAAAKAEAEANYDTHVHTKAPK